MKKLILPLLLLFASQAVEGAVWQWAVDVSDAPNARGAARAYLWIPEECERVRGIVFAQHNMEEVQILEDSGFRARMAGLDFAQVFVTPCYDLFFRFDQGAGDIFQRIMDSLARVSGYEEIARLPIAYMGHSAAASAPYYFAAWDPDRTLCAISTSGQWPYYRGDFAPDIWDGRTIDFVPCLQTMGEYENATEMAVRGVRQRAEHPLTPLSMLACPAEGHFASTPEKAEFIAFYIAKAVEYRLRGDTLRQIDPTREGWLAERWRGDEPPTADPAPVDEYTGERDEAFWFFDREHALRTQAYQARFRGMERALAGIVQGGEMLPQRDSHLQLSIPFRPEADGVTFTLGAAFYDTVPGGSPRPAIWTGLPAGSPVGHPDGGEPIDIEVICGPVKKIGPDTFRLDFGRNEIRSGRYSVAFAATHPGDDTYRPMVQQAEMLLPERLTEGRPQTISFDPPAVVRLDGQKRPIILEAASDAGLDVRFYVTEGPAEIDDNRLVTTDIPPRTRFPVTVRVEAWQYGSAERGIQSAPTVTRTILIEK